MKENTIKGHTPFREIRIEGLHLTWNDMVKYREIEKRLYGNSRGFHEILRTFRNSNLTDFLTTYGTHILDTIKEFEILTFPRLGEYECPKCKGKLIVEFVDYEGVEVKQCDTCNYHEH